MFKHIIFSDTFVVLLAAFGVDLQNQLIVNIKHVISVKCSLRIQDEGVRVHGQVHEN